MKYILTLLLASVTLLLAGCFETTEEITINTNGSGTYIVDMDMSGLFSFIEMMKEADTAASANLQKPFGRDIDSVINMRNFTDTAKNISPEYKALMRNARLHMLIKEKEQQMKMKMTFPFSKIEDIEKLAALSKSGEGTDLIAKALKGNSDAPALGGGSAEMPGLNNYYSLTYKKGLIERKINPEKIKDLAMSASGGEKNELMDMMASVKMNTIIHLPKAAKKVQGDKAKLSNDRKTITVSNTVADLLHSAKAFDFRIEY